MRARLYGSAIQSKSGDGSRSRCRTGRAIRGEVRLKITLSMMLNAVAVACCLAAAPSLAADTHTILTPSEIKWGPAPPFMRPGVQAVVLYGDPSKKGLFVIRLKFPKGYRLPPHFHPVEEIVEIISGTSQFGMG